MNIYPIPNFFIVGAPKCGTTSFHDYLNQNPDIFMSKVKELNYFNSEARPYYKYNNVTDYLINFQEATHHEIVGESSAWYLYSSDAAKNIYDFNKNAKILIMIRSPLESIPSLHSEMLYGSMEFERDLSKAIEYENERKNGIYRVKPIKTPERTHYLSVYKYDQQIERFLNYFDKRSIRLILFDEFKNNPQKEYSSIIEFLGIHNSLKPHISIKNANREVRSLNIQKIVADRGYFKDIIKALLPIKYRRQTKAILKRFNSRNKERKPLTKQEKDLILQLTGVTVSNLQKLLSHEKLIPRYLDIKKLWGYE